MCLPKVVVLMSVYNGEKYLKEQIESIENQKDVEVFLRIRDDGSTDKTVQIIESMAKTYGNIELVRGENIGYANSFLSLMKFENDESDYYAFSDQDDIWLPTKLARAISMIKSKNYCVYASSLTAVDENNVELKKIEFKHYVPTIGSVLSRNRLAGCTMVFDKALYKDINSQVDYIIEQNDFGYGHDGWLLIYCLINNGMVILDERSYIRYRRHSKTITNSCGGLKKRICNEFKIFMNPNDRRIRLAKFVIKRYKNSYSKECLRVLEDIVNYKHNPKTRLRLLIGQEIRCGLFIIDFKNALAIMLRTY